MTPGSTPSQPPGPVRPSPGYAAGLLSQVPRQRRVGLWVTLTLLGTVGPLPVGALVAVAASSQVTGDVSTAAGKPVAPGAAEGLAAGEGAGARAADTGAGEKPAAQEAAPAGKPATAQDGNAGTSGRDGAAAGLGTAGKQASPPGGGAQAAPAGKGGPTGLTARDDSLEFTVRQVECGRDRIGDDSFARSAQGQFCVVSLSVRNVGQRPQSFFDGNQKALTASGAQLGVDIEADFSVNGDDPTFRFKIDPGKALTRKIVYDIPKRTTITYLNLHDSAFSGGAKIRIT